MFLDRMSQDKRNESNESPETNVGLKRQLSLLGGIALQVGGIIGSGIFISPRFVALNGGSTGVILLIWSFCGFVSLLAGLCFVELALSFPHINGAEYSYINEAFGPMPAFVCSFILACFQLPAGHAMVALTCGDYILESFGVFDTNYTKLLAVVLIVVILVLNCLSVKWASHVQKLMTVLKMVPIVMIVVTGIVRLAQGHTKSFEEPFQASRISLSGIGYGFYAGLWSYGGWNNINYAMKEINNPHKNVPIVMWVSVPLVTLCYVLVNIGYLSLLLPEEIASTNATAVVFGQRLYGVMAWTIPAFVAFSTFGSANTSAFAGSRLIYASSRNGHLPNFFQLVHNTRHTPWMGVLLYSIISLVLLVPPSSNFGTLLSYTGFSTWLIYGATFAAVIWLRYKRPELHRPYKVFIGIPIFLVLCCTFLVLSPFFDNPLESSICLLFILFWIPMYFALVKYRVLPDKVYLGIEKFTDWIGKKTNSSIPPDEETKPDYDDVPMDETPMTTDG